MPERTVPKGQPRALLDFIASNLNLGIGTMTVDHPELGRLEVVVYTVTIEGAGGEYTDPDTGILTPIDGYLSEPIAVLCTDTLKAELEPLVNPETEPLIPGD